MTSTETPDFVATVSHPATETIRAMGQHVERIGIYYGKDSERYHKAASSLIQVLCTVFGSPMRDTATVYREGRPEELSLLLISGLTVGVIFHREKRVCTDPDCHTVIEDNGAIYRFGGDVKQHDHTPSYGLDLPTPGTWSMHS